MAKICVVEAFFGANDFADYFQRRGLGGWCEFLILIFTDFGRIFTICVYLCPVCVICVCCGVVRVIISLSEAARRLCAAVCRDRLIGD